MRNYLSVLVGIFHGFTVLLFHFIKYDIIGDEFTPHDEVAPFDSLRFDVTSTDVAYSRSAVSTGLSMPIPPNLTGKARILRSTSDTLRPTIDGISFSHIVSSNG